ncbi:hypothetical protein QJ133_10075 [Priestia megaterium]|uniref:hypothetical protein n=1 Tax=Priestia megaterium TaxID=1404 RepID=UPI00249B5050|nr:hypothetical protein [Priestia megaterium]MDI3091476.1 hypothetical protein [Priestia megaterium]
MSNKGRKPKMYPQDEINQIVFIYTQQPENTGLIKYMNVYRFALNLYETGQIPYKLSDDFWRKTGRQGRNTIDKTNEIYEYSVPYSESEDDKVIDSEDAINKFFEGKESNKDKLLGAVQINEKKLKRYIHKTKDLSKRLSNKDKKLSELKIENQLLKEKLNKYEEYFFQWLDASIDPDTPLINLITTGKTRSKVVDNLFNNMFSEEPFKLFEDFRRRQNDNGRTKKNNVVPLEKTMKNTLLEDLEL